MNDGRPLTNEPHSCDVPSGCVPEYVDTQYVEWDNDGTKHERTIQTMVGRRCPECRTLWTSFHPRLGLWRAAKEDVAP